MQTTSYVSGISKLHSNKCIARYLNSHTHTIIRVCTAHDAVSCPLIVFSFRCSCAFVKSCATVLHYIVRDEIHIFLFDCSLRKSYIILASSERLKILIAPFYVLK